MLYIYPGVITLNTCFEPLTFSSTTISRGKCPIWHDRPTKGDKGSKGGKGEKGGHKGGRGKQDRPLQDRRRYLKEAGETVMVFREVTREI